MGRQIRFHQLPEDRASRIVIWATNFGANSGTMSNPMKIREKVVGAKGFEPSTSWSRTRHLNPINALFGVAYGIRSVISPLSVLPNLCLELGSTPVVRGDSCAHLHHYFRVPRHPSNERNGLQTNETIATGTLLRPSRKGYGRQQHTSDSRKLRSH